jgi:hypothetical protein
MNQTSVFFAKPVRVGIILGILVGGAFSILLLLWSPHIPLSVNLLLGPLVLGGLGALLGLVFALVRMLRSSAASRSTSV